MGQQSAGFDTGKESVPRVGALETAHLARKARREDYRSLQQLFNRVLTTYLENRAMPFLVAVDVDADAVSRSYKHTATSSLWAIDAERATEAALQGRIDLQRAWFDLAQGKPVKPDVAAECISKCGRVYRSRGISPSDWYRPSLARGRYGRAA